MTPAPTSKAQTVGDIMSRPAVTADPKDTLAVAAARMRDHRVGSVVVVVAEPDIGDVRGLEGFYHYRQYSAVDLARERTLEDVWYLLFEGELPTLAQRDAFIAELSPLRVIPEQVRDVLPAIARVAP